MKFSKYVCAVLGLAALFAQGVRADATIPTRDDVVLGEWCGNYDNARSYAESQGVPILVYWGASSCAKCKKMNEALASPQFVAWRQERKIVMLYAKDTKDRNGSATKAWAKSGTNLNTGKPVTLTNFPFMMIYWKKDGVIKAEQHFTGRTGTMPSKVGKLLQEQLINSVDMFLQDYSGGPSGDQWDPADDTRQGAQNMAVERFEKSQAHTLGGEDLNDWFKFTVAPNSRYFVSFSNVTGSSGMPQYQVFNGDEGAAFDSGAVVNGKSFQFENTSGAPMVRFVRVYCAAGATDIAYTLTYKEYVPVSVGFESASMEFNAAGGSFVIPVVRGGDDESLKAVARVAVEAEGLDARYSLNVSELDWRGNPNNRTNVVVTANAANQTWPGDHTFKLKLRPLGSEAMVPFAETVITLNAGPPNTGTVGYAGYVLAGVTNAYLATAKPDVREGDIVTVLLARTDGSDLPVEVALTWPEGLDAVATLAWGNGEEGIKDVEIQIPADSALKGVRDLTLTVTSITNATLAAQKKALTFKVYNEFYAGPLAQYVAQNPALPLTTTDDAWFLADDGNLRSQASTGGKPAAMTAAVTGPGVLKFAMAPSDAATVTLDIKGQTAIQTAIPADGEVYGYIVPEGKQTITLSATGAGYAAISDLVYIPLTAAVTPIAPRTDDVVHQDSIRLQWNAVGAEQLAGINGVQHAYAVFAGTSEKTLEKVADLQAGSTSYDLTGASLGTLVWRVAISVEDLGGTKITLNGAAQKIDVVGTDAPGWLLDTETAQITGSTFIGVQTVFGPFAVVNATGVKVKSGALPVGMSLTSVNGAWWVTGVPSKAASNARVVLQAMNGKSGGTTFALNYTVAPLPREVTGTFNGAGQFAASALDTTMGLASLTVSAAGKISGKLTSPQKVYTFSATGFDAAPDGQFVVTNAQFTANAKKEAPVPLNLMVSVEDGLGGAVVWSVAGYEIDDDGEEEPVDEGGTVEPREQVTSQKWLPAIEANLYRDGWSDSPLAPAREAALRLALNYNSGALSSAPGGYYTAALSPSRNQGTAAGQEGSGFLTMTLDKKGKVKVAGRLADGTSVSLSSALLLSDTAFGLNLFSAPKTYSGGYLLVETGFARDSQTGTILVDGDALWENRNPKATGVQGEGFRLRLEVLGGWYSKKTSLVQMYPAAADGWNAEAQGVEIDLKANKRGTGFDASPCKSEDNPACLKLSVKMKTGLFKGTLIEAASGKKVKLLGVLTPALTQVYGYEQNGFSGKGFFLIPQASPYKHNKSGNFVLWPDCGCGE